MIHRVRLLLLLLVLIVPTFVLAACGSSGDDDVEAVLAATFGPDRPIRSGKLDLALKLDLKGVASLRGPVSLNVSGPFQSNGKRKLPDFDLALDLATGGQSFTAGAVSTGEAGFLKLQGRAFDVGKELYESFRASYEQASKGSEKNEGPSFASLGIKPLNWLTSPRRAGEEQIGGAQTIHIAAKVDVKRFLADVTRLLDKARGLKIAGAGRVPGGLSAKQRDQIARSVSAATVDVWTGKEDKTLRRIVLAIALAVPADVRKDVGGLTGGKIAFSLTIADLNKKQTVTGPKDARPIAELAPALQALGLGGLGGSGAGAGGATTTPAPSAGAPPAPSAGGGAPKQYLDCLQEAGQDIAKVQGCARFLQ